jgi:hypothetical protein
MEIKISKSARHCHSCDKSFTHEQRMVSALRRGPEGWLREDFCPGCWSDERGTDALCVWSAQFADPQVLEQQPAEVLSPLRQAFYEAVEGPGRPSIALAYLAGQLLRRQKAFRFIKQAVDPETDAAVMLFLDRIGNRMIEVHDPNLTTAELERGRVALLHRLAEIEGTLDESETAAVAADPGVQDASPQAGKDEPAEDEYEEDEFDDDDDDEDDDDELDDEEIPGDGETEDEYAQT